jgi:HK97 family phage major capsid protein
MATSTYPAMGGAQDNTSQANFIPELWSDEIIAAYKQQLVLANLVSKMPMTGKKGDTIHVPKPSRGAVSAKAEGAAVTVQNPSVEEVIVLIDQHFEYSRFIEDITTTQALNSMRAFYTGDAGYSLARQVDTDLHNLGTGLGDSAGKVAAPVTADWVNSAVLINSGSGLTPFVAAGGAGTAFDDTAFRDLVQLLDDADVPMDNRSFVVPPAMRNVMLGIDRYVSSDFSSSHGVNNGLIGELYGINVYVTTACPVIETGVRAATLVHKDTYVHAEQMGVRAQTQYKQEFLADLFTSDTIYGTQVMRPDAGFVLAVAG